MVFSVQCQFISAATAGAFFTLTGSLFMAFWPQLFDAVLNTQLVLTPDSYSNELWEVTPIPVYIDFYFWNWTNPEDLFHPDPKRKKPKLVQLGPYVYREDRRKVVLNWNDQNNTVTFMQNKTWFYEPELSVGSLDDVVTTVNIPALAATFAIREYPYGIKVILNGVMNYLRTTLTVKKKVRQFLFEGYEDPLVDLSQLVPPGILPVIIPFDKFGWFYTRNGSATYDGVFNMFTGKGNIRKFGTMGEWNYENPTTKYEGHCGQLSGASAGEFFLPKPEKGGKISLFSPDMCRTLTLGYKEEVKVDGIRGYRYWGDSHIFENVSTKPDDWCYCPSGKCAPSGAVDVSTCKWGAPAFISFPHFLNADPHYRESVDGMNPKEELHQMYIDLERRTGIPLQVEASLQINLLLQPFPEYDLFEGVPKIYLPIIWFKERARIDDGIGPKVRLVSRIPDAGYILFGAFIVIGLSILIIVGLCYLRSRRRKGDSELTLTNFDTNAAKQ